MAYSQHFADSQRKCVEQTEKAGLSKEAHRPDLTYTSSVWRNEHKVLLEACEKATLSITQLKATQY